MMAVDNHFFTIVEISTVSAVKFKMRYKVFHRNRMNYFIFMAKSLKTWIFCGFSAFCNFFTVTFENCNATANKSLCLLIILLIC